MENHVNFLEPLIENAKVYENTSIELYKLKAIEKISETSSTLVSRVMVFSLLVLFILMVSVGIAFWLGNFMGKIYFGFLCVGGFYGLAGVVLYFFLHSWIKERVNNSIIRQMLS
jgi:hypothetical protein